MEKITKKAKISLYMDTRKPTKDGIYPVRIQVYYGSQRYYFTGKRLSLEDFDNSYKAVRPRGEYNKQLKIELSAIEAKANEVAEGLESFTFEKFEKQLFETKQSLTNLVDRYANYIKELEKNERIGTASSYRCSINSLKSFVNSTRTYPTEIILFSSVTPDFLNRYEQWMIANDNSRTSVGIYLRALRTIFNQAIEDKIIDGDLYPFKKFRIPTGKNTKKAIEPSDLKIVFDADLSANFHQEKARAFWFFSYQCNGMNIRDISELKFKDLHGTYFSFLRHKTINTTKEDPKPIIVPITPYVQSVFDKYGNQSRRPNDYVFPIFQNGMTAEERHIANQNFVRFINQHMKKVFAGLGLQIKSGTMEARHSFTTQVNRAIGLEFAQEALGHTTLVATQNYWAGFNSDVKKEMADSLMNFDEAKPKAAARKKGALKFEEIQPKRKAVRRVRLA
jgi:integrase/recombinase XerD